LFIIRCADEPTAVLRKELKVPAPILPSGCRIVRRDAVGNVVMVGLSEDAEIDGLPCLGHRVVHFHSNGRLAQCDLAQETTVQDIRFAAGSILQIDDQGRLQTAWAAGPVIVAGREYPEDCALDFAPDGSVASWTRDGEVRDAADRLLSRLLLTPRDIDGVPCAAERVSFHPSGRLESATLARDATVGSLALPRGTIIGLDEEGGLQSVFAPTMLAIGGTEYPAGAFLELDAGGRVTRFARIEVRAASCPVPRRTE
jgi:hypothetical protein